MQQFATSTLSSLLLLLALTCQAIADDSIYSQGRWRKSLSTCWTDSTCERVLTTAHGGYWNLTYPYDSLPAFQKAYEYGADSVKGDFRVAKDNIGMVMHSSPIEFYESINCRGKYVEEMTSEECKSCQMEFTSYTFISVPDFLEWGRNKMNIMLCVKESHDIPRAILTLIENNATDYSFLEVHLGDLITSMSVTNWDKVYYVLNLGSYEDFQTFLTTPKELQQRCFLVELNNWEDWADDDLQTAITTIHTMGLKAFGASRDNPLTATTKNHLTIYETGMNVAYTYNLENAVEARKIINTGNGIVPP